MSPPRGGTAMSSSPHSIDETTNLGTPSTNLTAFTPEVASGTKGRVANSAGRPVLTLATTKPKHASVCDESEEDVFLTAPSTSRGLQLSPAAEVFTPRLSAGILNKYGAAQLYNLPQIQENAPIRRPGKFEYFPVNVPGVINPLRAAPVDENAHIYGFGLLKLDQTPYNYAAGVYVHDVTIIDGKFSAEEGVSRSFIVTGLKLEHRSRVIARHFPINLFPSIRGIDATSIGSGLFIVSCSDLRDSKKAAGVSHDILPYSFIFPLTAKTYAGEHGLDPDQVSDYEGQCLVSIYYNPNAVAPKVKAAPVIAEIKRLLAQCGDVKAFHTCPSVQAHVRDIRVEFYNSDAVACAKDVISGTMIQGCVLDVVPYQPDVRRFTPSDEEDEAEQLSITGRTRLPMDDDYHRLAFDIHRAGPHRGRRVNQNNHNAVDVTRIQAGADVRTTIMLRNIPNRIDQAGLKNFLDATSKGRYDFMYLRIDFANNCNVGYAFINFTDAQSIIPFVLARAGKPWNVYDSHKVAEVSYATIQGKDCLVQKFRNSSVMLEHPGFRPKLFIAGNVPNAGQEEQFPDPDNHSKMRRSVENAEHVGLYYPARRPSPGHCDCCMHSKSPRSPRRRSRRAGRPGFGPARRDGIYLSPARARMPEPMEINAPTPPPARRIPFLVDTRSPYDPFAGYPRANPSLRS